ncbi:hypothetical protein FRUB_04482 [Fimbriiglobus ruber]|uniref:DUF7448 domain-containing protein n=2 Tax=Fimbriiglobus ruber TaxID=1908690 RepID=A0A225DS25_9BACT|nr:hypothetical protein FRUB_04075 [Fimbriiglobus ruber]OWK42404.1 hypothetical protein FRUB_04482 [Fimbriiglobus ruber]
MVHYLTGGSKHDPKEYYGKRITSAEFADNRLLIGFEGGVRIAIFDDGQSCCESRYMTTADDVTWLVGKTLKAIAAKEGPEVEGECGDSHEQVFLEIETPDGSITFANHNEHNGYYGGFGLTIEEVEREVA